MIVFSRPPGRKRRAGVVGTSSGGAKGAGIVTHVPSVTTRALSGQMEAILWGKTVSRVGAPRSAMWDIGQAARRIREAVLPRPMAGFFCAVASPSPFADALHRHAARA